MPEQGLKLVLSFDAVSQSFKPSAHNLTADQAVSYADHLHAGDGLDSRIIGQKTRHKATSADGCGPCKKTCEVENKASQAERQKPEEESAAGEEHEGE